MGAAKRIGMLCAALAYGAPVLANADEGAPSSDATIPAERAQGRDPGADAEAFATVVGHSMRMRATERWARRIRSRGFEGPDFSDIAPTPRWSVTDRGSYAIVEVHGLQTRDLHPLGVGRKLVVAMDRGPKGRRAEWTGDVTVMRLELRGVVVPRLVLKVRHDAKWTRRIANETMVVPTDDGFRVLVPRRHALAKHRWPAPRKPTLQQWLADN